MSKKIKRDKEQKGKNAVLVIAIGKHPKMGPGARKVKKAEERKSKSQMRRERRAAKQAKREAKAKESGEEVKDTSEAGREATKKLQMSQRAKKHYERMKESGDPTDVRDYVERRRINMKDLAEELGISTVDLGRLNVEQGAFQDAIDRLAGDSAKSRKDAHEEFMNKIGGMSIDDMASNFALTPKGGGKLTNEQRAELAKLIGVQATDIRENSPMLENRKLELYNAMKEMGQQAFATRQHQKIARRSSARARREARREKKTGGGKPIHFTSGYDPEVLERIAATRGISVEQLYDMITGQGGGDEEELNERGDVMEGEDSQMRNAPSSVFTTPYATREGAGFKSGSMRNPGGRNDDAGGERGSSFKPGQTVEDTMHGFKAPTSFGLARVGEYHLQPDQEANYDEVDRTMENYQRGEPMDLAFRILKEGMCKGDDCDGCKSCKTCPKCKPKGSTCDKMGC
jgi:hypothetical protein